MGSDGVRRWRGGGEGVEKGGVGSDGMRRWKGE